MTDYACNCCCGYDNPYPPLIVAHDAFVRCLQLKIPKAKVIIISGCRCPPRNAECQPRNKQNNSFHMNGMAEDVRFENVNLNKPLHRKHVLEAIEESPFAGGGAKLYQNSAHLDMRGHRVRW